MALHFLLQTNDSAPCNVTILSTFLHNHICAYYYDKYLLHIYDTILWLCSITIPHSHTRAHGHNIVYVGCMYGCTYTIIFMMIQQNTELWQMAIYSGNTFVINFITRSGHLSTSSYTCKQIQSIH